MNNASPLSVVRERNKRKRLAGWVFIYLLLITVLVLAVFWQVKRINTLNFASGQLQLTTSKAKYTVGDDISYTLKNGLDHSITLLNKCPAEPLYVYAWTNNSWVRIHDTASPSVCESQPSQMTIVSGASYTQNFTNWPNLFKKPGIYRIVELATNYTALPYADFQVVAKPTPLPTKTQIQVIIQKVVTPIYIPVPSGGDGGGDN
ncbi:MAG TPA: hypothetical protein VFN56_03445 [Candidatus Saccharimonadales bacterium]|nr:hypothetical protein [Candidatus Saccharimonadales bacterium]